MDNRHADQLYSLLGGILCLMETWVNLTSISPEAFPEVRLIPCSNFTLSGSFSQLAAG